MVQVLVAVFGTTDRTSSSLLRTVVAISGADSSIISAPTDHELIGNTSCQKDHGHHLLLALM
jgi:hypothetical protein